MINDKYDVIVYALQKMERADALVWLEMLDDKHIITEAQGIEIKKRWGKINE